QTGLYPSTIALNSGSCWTGEPPMECKPLLVAGMWIGLFLTAAAGAQDKSPPAGETGGKKNSRIPKPLDEKGNQTQKLKDKKPLPKFFAVLETKLPKDKKITFRIDERAFGVAFALISASEVRLLHGRGNEKTNLHSALHKALRQLPKGAEADYGFRADGVVLT